MIKNILKKLSDFLPKNNLKLQRGSTIIELLIAVMVVGLIITAVANAVTYSIKNTGESRYRQVATTLGQEVIEHFHTQKNELGIINLINILPQTEYCYSDIDSPTAGVCGTGSGQVVDIPGVGTEFKRNVTINSGGDGTRTPLPAKPYYLTVTVTVSWIDGAETRSVELIQEFKQDSGFRN